MIVLMCEKQDQQRGEGGSQGHEHLYEELGAHLMEKVLYNIWVIQVLILFLFIIICSISC